MKQKKDQNMTKKDEENDEHIAKDSRNAKDLHTIKSIHINSAVL